MMLPHKKERNEYDKQYREKNKDKRNEYDKQYRETHKTELSAKAAEKVTCEVCGSVVRKSDISSHRKSKKHQNALNQSL
jgi:hypothetical protein